MVEVVLQTRHFGIMEALSTRGRVEIRVNMDFATLLGPPSCVDSTWLTLKCGPTTPLVRLWLCSVSIFGQFTAFLDSVHWHVGKKDLGMFRVSYSVWVNGMVHCSEAETAHPSLARAAG